MPRPKSDRPTHAELAILRALWKRGPSTVREVHESLGQRAQTGYTTTLKLIQIMAEKKLVTRTEEGRVHRYRAAVSESDTQKRMVTDLIERAFGGSAAGLVMQALTSKRASKAELEKIQDLIDRARKEQG